jgi:hypothetical protein
MKRYFSYILLAIFTFSFSIILVFGLNKIFPVKVERHEREIFPKVEQAKTPSFIDFKDLTIKGIGLDSNDKDVIKKLGKPRSRKSIGFYNCEETKAIFYKGLEMSLAENTETKNWEVYQIELTSSNFQLDSGIKIGDSIESIKQKIGKDFSERKEKSITELDYYDGNYGWATFYFRNNKLEKINWLYNFC